jgi:protein-S-isoprenylcysteine O-methyltransferase Ste14
MKLQDSLEKQGDLLFRNRGFIPILFILFSIPVSYFNSYEYLIKHEALEYTTLFSALGFIFLGHLIRAQVILARQDATSGRNRSEQVADSLNTKGWYSIVRNPLYVANFLIWFGLSIYLFSFWLSLVLVLMFWMYYERIIFAEEAFLSKKFGETYTKWCNATPVFIPRLTGFVPIKYKFSLSKVIFNEYSSMLSTGTCFLFVALLREYSIYDNIHIGKHTLIYISVLATFGLMVKGIKVIRKSKG